MNSNRWVNCSALMLLVAGLLLVSASARAQNVTFKPYIQPGDNGPFGAADQMVVAWQTDETAPNPGGYLVQFGTTSSYGRTASIQGRVVDNYLAAEPSLPLGGTPYGPHTAYTAVLSGLDYDTVYYYRVSGPGLPSNGFQASFHTRKRTGSFSFAVEGDEGYFPQIGNNQGVDYEARIIHEIYDAGSLSLPGQPNRPNVDFVVNTGDNVYNLGAQDSYRDFWFPVWNADVDSNETGAPLARSIPVYVVAGNHDTGGNGDFVNLLSSGVTPPFSGGLGGGDALDYFNDYYYPLNGPAGFDSQWVWNGNSATQNGWYLSYNNQAYSSPSVFEALRDSTSVDTGKGTERQLDRMANYSFDYGSAHFLYLDANPHLFDALVDYSATYAGAPQAFPDYPTQLRNWIIHDLDSSNRLWKIVVYHQPAFSSGNGTLRNFQMRAIAEVLEDHGVNLVLNGHEHNYQRTLPLRFSDHVAAAPNTNYGSPAVMIDTHFDGKTDTVPDGLITLIEGAGGNRDFDGDYSNPRGNGTGIDQDDSATGLFTLPDGTSVGQGPASWLDVNLTTNEMGAFIAGAGSGPKITAKFKSKIFSFGDVVVDHNNLTVYQISEPLQNTSSATAADPAPYGVDYYGHPLDDPIPDTVLDLSNGGKLLSPPAAGTPALLDKFTITKPEFLRDLHVALRADRNVQPDSQFTYTLDVRNGSGFALNGTQAVFRLSSDVTFLGSPDGLATTQFGNTVVVTLGRLASGGSTAVRINVLAGGSGLAIAEAELRSGTALPVYADRVATAIGEHSSDHDGQGRDRGR
jgi:Calcineurin-like phosphoesterase/Purple acid Phosphatase, N-terminal domain